ncbi:MAG: sigma-70 family RNA polymerase sigma factor [Verrucomicrobiales bacterium]|nr:sigma-70 family RNA polymerase sigma factor [Verrucomicrobiales bacterium]
MRANQFQTTCWKNFRDLTSGDACSSQRAMNDICRTYWQPLYQFALSLNCSHEDAEDCVQGFLAKATVNDFFVLADPKKGRMRSYLLTAFKRYIYDVWKKDHALKRGGGTQIESLENNRQNNSAENSSLVFDQQWALTIIETAMGNLKLRYHVMGKNLAFSELEACIDGSPLANTAKIAETLDISTATLKTLVYRIRKRFGEEVRKAVMETVATEEEIDDELRWLIEVLGKHSHA